MFSGAKDTIKQCFQHLLAECPLRIESRCSPTSLSGLELTAMFTLAAHSQDTSAPQQQARVNQVPTLVVILVKDC